MKSLKPNRWRRVATTALSAVLLGAAVSACAPLIVGGAMTGALMATDRRTSGAQVEDQGIELRAGNRLREQIGQRGNVSVTSYNRQVLLTGEVASEQDTALAETTVAGVENVRSVVNELDILGASSLTQRSSDTLITGRVKAAMVDARDLPASAVKVLTTRGTVYLMGRLTQREADRATEITRNTQGVQRVVRVLEIISEEELARLLPKPAESEKAAPAK